MKKTDYFDLMARQAQCSMEAARLLKSMLDDYQPTLAASWREQMHRIEHKGDEIRHEAMKSLARDFITPIEQDDLLQLVQILDDVTDAIEEAAIELYMYNVACLPSDAARMAALVLQCVTSLNEAVAEFRRFKKPERLMRLLVDVNTMESEADTVYIEAMHALFVTERDPLRAIGAKAIYESLESCCDLCEHAADVMESVVMNNT